MVHYRCDSIVMTGGSTSGCVGSPHFANLYDMHKKYADVLPVARVMAYYAGLTGD